MICSTCKASNVEGARFCSGCGMELRERDSLPPKSPVPEDETTRLQSVGGAQEVTLVNREDDPLVGSEIAGKYRIGAKLGAGGMGAVYRATRLQIGDEVAVKILHVDQNAPNAAERFRREAQAAARLKHPNAVSIYDFGVTYDGLQYLVMELVEGQSLRQIIKQQGPLTPSAAADVLRQVCAALDEAHGQQIVHRDLKPDNIVVSTTRTDLRVKVLDFGIAKLRDMSASNLTQTGSVMGTPHYMSPEQCLGEELDHRSDIYSLGIVLYEMLAGVVPFHSPQSTAVVIQHVNQSPPSLRTINLSISAAVEAVVFHALAKKREDRPQTVQALATEFLSAVSGTFQLAQPAQVNSDSVNTGERDSATAQTVVLRPASLGQSVGPTSAADKSRSQGTPGGNKTVTFTLILVAGVTLIALGAVIALISAGTFRSKEIDGRANSNSNTQSGNSIVNSPNATSNSSSQTPPGTIEDPKSRHTKMTSNEAEVRQGSIPPTIESAQSLINRWQNSQNTQNFSAYESCYDYSFRGVLRTTNGRVKVYGFDEWMRDRRRMINQGGGLNVDVRNMRVQLEADGATIEFDQFYRSGSYSDWGPKVIKIRTTSVGEKIVYEELKASNRL